MVALVHKIVWNGATISGLDYLIGLILVSSAKMYRTIGYNGIRKRVSKRYWSGYALDISKLPLGHNENDPRTRIIIVTFLWH